MLKKWNVIGFIESTGKIVSHEVEAANELSAFALAARANDSLTLVAAIPSGVTAEFPGESLVHAQTVIEQDGVFPVSANDVRTDPAVEHVCPNCGEAADGHPVNGCVLAALISVLADRGELPDERLLELHAGANTDAMWLDLGPVVDKLGEGYYL